VGIILQKHVDDATICVWELDGSERAYWESANFLPGEKERIAAIRSELKRMQRVAVRMLLNMLSKHEGNRLEYDEFNKPYLSGPDWHISISHAGDKVAVMVDGSASPGIDIEVIDPKIERIAKKFMSRDEMKDVEGENRVEKLYVYWAAKEAMYKIHGTRGLHFIGDLHIEPFRYDPSGGNVRGSITTGSRKGNYGLHYEKTGGHMLVYRSNWVSCQPQMRP
jgi:4'-phosphopantetheinyl transferase